MKNCDNFYIPKTNYYPSKKEVTLMQNEKYLAIDVGGTSIKYAVTDRNAKITKNKSDFRHCTVLSGTNQC